MRYFSPILLLYLLPFAPILGQMNLVYIDSISIEGNKKTKTDIILREIGLGIGDTLTVNNLPTELERNEKLIMNTGLFSSANITFKNWQAESGKIHLLIVVEEAWYIYPIPVFELADRNFNVWWVEQNRSLQRINFGMDFAHLNISGQMDRLKVEAKFGYTRKYELAYSLPYINRAKTMGLSAEVSFSRNRELNYATVGNKQQFFKLEDQFIYQRFSSGIDLSYRPRIKNFHSLYVGFRQNKIDEIIAKELNPEFFLEGRELQRYFNIGYRFVYDNRDVRPYPWKGDLFYFIAEKDGLGLFGDRNGLTFWTGISHFQPFGKRWSLASGLKFKYSAIRQPQPYNDNRALGFGEHSLHGYEYYIVDGLDLALLKSSLHFSLWEGNLNFGRIVPISAFRKMPLRLFLSLNNDLGYANSPFNTLENPLNNRLMWGGGLGFDIVIYYDKVFQIEYSFNDLLENGLFLHFSFNI